jgi:hypothetical protein
MASGIRWSEENHAAWQAKEAAREADRPALKLTPTEIPEAQVLKSVLAALLRHPKVARAWRVNSGAGHLVYRNGGASQFIRFGFPGAPDLHGVMNDGRALFVECKRAGGRLTDDQDAFLCSMRKVGAVAFVAFGVEDVMRELA